MNIDDYRCPHGRVSEVDCQSCDEEIEKEEALDYEMFWEEEYMKCQHGKHNEDICEVCDKENIIQDILNDRAQFTWSFGQTFFVETMQHGNFIWSDPDYQGDNSFTPFHDSYNDWCKESGIPYGRDKGTHEIKSYCGSDIWLR